MFAALAPAYDLEFARAVSSGLKRKQKTIPACWLYDDLGSALFEAITFLPEYGLTRADEALLRQCSPEIVKAAGNPSLIVELGSGTGTKTRHLLEAAAARKPVHYIPIDISKSALRSCELSLRGMRNVLIEPVASTYFEGLNVALSRRRSGERALVLFLGSTIGNFSPSERSFFLQQLRKSTGPGDSLLLGTDLIKRRDILLRAYDDALGVTAAFNLNLLTRINRELGGNFEVSSFDHEARFHERQSRIEMHVRSREAQQVHIGELNLSLSFKPGETIWTESCHKFRKNQLRQMGLRAGWSTAAQWVDRDWGFAETLFTA